MYEQCAPCIKTSLLAKCTIKTTPAGNKMLRYDLMKTALVNHSPYRCIIFQVVSYTITPLHCFGLQIEGLV